MNSATKTIPRLLFVLLVLVTFLNPKAVSSQSAGALFLAGQPSDQATNALLKALKERDTDGKLKFTLIPVAISPSVNAVSEEMRNILNERVDSDRNQLLENCSKLALSCEIKVAPTFSRDDAQNPQLTEYFPGDLDGVILLDGNPVLAMQIMRGTLLEALIVRAHQGGTLIAGLGATSTIISNFMLSGIARGKTPSESLDFRAIEAGLSSAQRGLPLLSNAVISQHPLGAGNLGCLLNAIVLPEAPGIGIGLDADSSALFSGQSQMLEYASGDAPILILDAQTYHATETVFYHGPRYSLSLRNVLVHTLTATDETVSYNLVTRQHSLAESPATLDRIFETLSAPSSAGPLILSGGDLELDPAAPIFNRFLNLSGGREARLALVLIGQADANKVLAAVQTLENRLNLPIKFILLATGQNLPADFLSQVSGIMLFATNEFSSAVQIPIADTSAALINQLSINDFSTALESLRQAWLEGMPLLAAGQAAGWISAVYYPAFPTEDGTGMAWLDKVTPLKGIGFLPVAFESRLLSHPQGWSRLLGLALARPDLLALGLDSGNALLFTARVPEVLGTRPIAILDLSLATFSPDKNRNMTFANGLLDIFAPGETIVAAPARSIFKPFRLGTPVLPTQTSTVAPTATVKPTLLSTATPTSTPSLPSPTPTERLLLEKIPTATPTPMIIVNPLSRRDVNRMIALSFATVVVIFFGLWLNHRRISGLPKE